MRLIYLSEYLRPWKLFTLTTGIALLIGDTLAKIAQRLRPEGIALEQALVGLYRENTDAFSGKNINRLKAGRTLRFVLLQRP